MWCFFPVCADINECVDEVDNCSEDADCLNTIGSYDCSCVNGYEGDGIICTGYISASALPKTVSVAYRHKYCDYRAKMYGDTLCFWTGM